MKLTPIGPNQTEIELETKRGDSLTLFFSYQTLVALHVDGLGFFRTSTKWSKTTSRHISGWLARHGAGTINIVPQESIDGMLLVEAAIVEVTVREKVGA